MRLLVVNWHDWLHPQAGGAEVHLRELLGRWSAWGHDVTLLCAGESGHPREERWRGVRILRAGRRPAFNWAVPAAYRRLRRQPFDVVLDVLNKVPLYLPLYAGRPVVGLVHHLFGSTVFAEAQPALAGYVWLFERGLRVAYRRTPMIVISNSTYEDLVERGIPPENIDVVPPGVDAPPADLAEPRSPEPLFVYLGRLKRYKGVEGALRAFARVLVELPEARFAVAGYGDHAEALAREAVRLGISKRVTFHGRVDEAAKWRLLARAWALVYTSPKEGFGLSSVEAQAAATPAVVSDSPGLRETIAPGESGFLVAHGDVAALASRMLELGRSRELVERMGERGRSFAARFTWDRAAGRTLDACERRLRWRRIQEEVARAPA